MSQTQGMKKSIAIKILLPQCAGIAMSIAGHALNISPAKAQGTWIEVYRQMRSIKPGTMGETFCEKHNWCGEAIYVDATSVVRRGDYAYYNWGIEFLNKAGMKTEANKPIKPRGVEANCLAKTVKILNKGWTSWDEAGKWESSAAQFACR